MTLVFALDCTDGLLLVSDSQETLHTAGQPLKRPTDKIYAPWQNIAWGASGHGSIIQAVKDETEKRAVFTGMRNSGIDQVKKQLHDMVVRVVRPILLEQHINMPGNMPPHTSYIFAGHVPDGPFIFEIHTDLLCTNCIERGYTAIGSGEIFPLFALANIEHFNVRGRTLREAKLIAYRIMEDALNVAASGIGPPIQMIEIVKPEGGAKGAGTCRVIPADEIESLKAAVLAWKVVEAESLSQSLGLPPAPEATT